MRKLSLYEQLGIVVPGSVLLLGIVLLQPELKLIFTKEGVTLGGLGVFVLIAYASGHLVAGLANGLELCGWQPLGGMPSSWVIKKENSLLNEQQIALLKKAIHTHLKLDDVPIVGMKRADWDKVFQQLYRRVLKKGRVQSFNASYGLNRGLVAATLVLAIAVLVLAPDQRSLAVALFVTSAIFVWRAYRYGVHFAREVYAQFLLLPDKSVGAHSKNKKAKILT